MNCKKIAASILAFTLITGAAASNNSVINSIIPTNQITASAITLISYGDWQFYITSAQTATIYKYIGSAKDAIVPESIYNPNDGNYYSVKNINCFAFANNTTITSVSIPRGITEIENNTFAGAEKLSSVSLPAGIKKIGHDAFNGTNISSISLPTSLETIDSYAFKNTPLTSITFYDNLKRIGTGAFSETALTSIIFPSSLKTIGSYAFAKTPIKKVTIPSTVTKINRCAFSNCLKLGMVTFEGNCSMEDSLFQGCTKLYGVYMNEAAFESAAKSAALGGCPNLNRVNGTQIVKYSGPEPYFAAPYDKYLKKYFLINDKYELSFTLDYIDKMIDYVVDTQTAGCVSDLQKIRNLHDWLCNKVEYAHNDYNANDTLNYKESAWETAAFFRDTIICDGYAKALTLLLRKAGVEAYYMHSDTHAWNMVKVDNRYFHLDACHDDKSYFISNSHFLKSDADIQKCSSGHNSWIISIPQRGILDLSPRYDYTIPSKTPVCQYSLGDVNMDGKVNKTDANLIGKANAFLYTIPDKTLADVNGDGTVDVDDQVAIYDLF